MKKLYLDLEVLCVLDLHQEAKISIMYNSFFNFHILLLYCQLPLIFLQLFVSQLNGWVD